MVTPTILKDEKGIISLILQKRKLRLRLNYFPEVKQPGKVALVCLQIQNSFLHTTEPLILQ